MLERPQILQSDAQRMAAIRLVVPRKEIQAVMAPGIGELYAALAAQGIAPTGPWFSHHFRMDPEVFDFEICLPVSGEVAAVGRVQPGELRAARVARTVYQGGYEGLGAAWGEFSSWITAQGLKPATDLWEVYLVGPESGPHSSKYRTQLNRPLID